MKFPFFQSYIENFMFMAIFIENVKQLKHVVSVFGFKHVLMVCNSVTKVFKNRKDDFHKKV